MAEDKPIEITTELIEKARAAKSADEIAAIADEQGVEMSGEETASIYASLHEAEGEIADDELDNVAGGGCGEPPPRRPCSCGEQYHRAGSQVYHGDPNNRQLTQYYYCTKCGAHWENTTTVDIPWP